MLVVVGDDDDASYDVPASRLPKDCRAEGTVLDVPAGKDGKPSWKDAKRSREEERLRLKDATDRIERLRRRDPGGDVQL